MLFDIDGTLVNSDALHFEIFQDMLEAAGFNGGARIDEAFFKSQISGRAPKRSGRPLVPRPAPTMATP